MAQPLLTYRLDWTPYNNPSEKLSTAAPFFRPDGVKVTPNKVDLYFSSSVDFKKLFVTIVKEDGRNYGFIDDVLVDIEGDNPTGILIADYYLNKANVEFSETIDADNHFKFGDGLYRIGLYVQDYDGYWNYEYFFIPTDSDYFELIDESLLQVTVKTM